MTPSPPARIIFDCAAEAVDSSHIRPNQAKLIRAADGITAQHEETS